MNKSLISSCRNDYNIYYPDIYTHLSGKKWENHFNYDEVDKFIFFKYNHNIDEYTRKIQLLYKKLER